MVMNQDSTKDLDILEDLRIRIRWTVWSSGPYESPLSCFVDLHLKGGLNTHQNIGKKKEVMFVSD